MDKPKEIICALCGYVNSDNSESCRSCGNLLGLSSAEDVGAQYAEPSADQTIMIFNRRSAPRRYRLVMIDQGGGELESFEIMDGSMIGRTSGDIQLSDRRVSRRHCAFAIRNGHLYLKDLNSTNGVFLRIRSTVQIEAPKELMLGHTVCRVVRKS